jgi:hypothetical protein
MDPLPGPAFYTAAMACTAPLIASPFSGAVFLFAAGSALFPLNVNPLSLVGAIDSTRAGTWNEMFAGAGL